MTGLSAHIDRTRASLPSLRLDSVRHNPDGLANDVLIVNDELVLRFPKDGRKIIDLQHNANTPLLDRMLLYQ
jgi:hypothetical protein